ncbi:uncharacterized protein Z519_03087 [Cladophialophora bantiana CBS 173.52]|uniref:Phytanoyl-CoA dioxygenase n=1 Tax=Cladophialophora bantiana (strain ATCC 10958 / CBS 173.52 / CDC B-1940 / NIH 8579) TaxID=1442370 RepID=A0A0D2F1I8_CLAB1|nr:uncharacterized protein Z519_03087 [Cladophialophora bantiana CBS 173.52]KIW96021.1 hypothetical protein Z519_03087 [Cladophialophora bantiana CBS 173.52]
MSSLQSTTTQTITPIPLSTRYGDWRDDLLKNGYTVIKAAIPPDRANSYQQRAFDWLKSFNTPLDFENPDTWVRENLPVLTDINTFENYSVVHEKFMWDARLEPGVFGAFAKLWGTEELLVSFDSLNVTFPNRKDKPRKPPWPHIDQSPLRRGLQCVQGIIALSKAGPEDGSLMVVPRSNNHVEEYFDTKTDPGSWDKIDWRVFDEEEMEFFHSQGLTPIKVEVEPGDLILWDSRTIHWGAEPEAESNTIRTVIYVSYSPAALASAESIKMKQQIFRDHGATTHWAHDNIFPRDLLAYLPDGSVDPRNRSEPLEPPELTDRLLKVAGMKPY